MGDFNNHLEEVTEYLIGKNIQPILKDGEPTHEKGGQMDQIFTNLETTDVQKIAYDFTDHTAFLINLRLVKRHDEIDIRAFPQNF